MNEEKMRRFVEYCRREVEAQEAREGREHRIIAAVIGFVLVVWFACR